MCVCFFVKIIYLQETKHIHQCQFHTVFLCSLPCIYTEHHWSGQCKSHHSCMEILHSHQYCIHNWCLNKYKRCIQVLLLKNIYLWNHLYNHICTYFHHPSIGLHWDMDCFHSHLYCTGSWYPQSPSHNYRCSYLSHLDICHVCHRVDQHSHQCWCHSFFLYKK